MHKIRIVFVEDDPIWVKAMTDYINNEKDMIITAVAKSKEESLKLISSLEVDVVLMDINLSENKYDGIYAAMDIHELNPEIKIIMLTCLKEDDVMLKSFAVGALFYVPKSHYKDIPPCIRMTYNNPSFNVLSKDYAKLKENEYLEKLGLTQAEKEIITLAKSGYSQSSMEKQLNKTRNTIKSQIKSILNKLKAVSIKDAIDKVYKKL